MRYETRRQKRAGTPLEWFELDMLGRGLSGRTIRDRPRTVRRVANERPPEDLTEIDVARFLERLEVPALPLVAQTG